jgi:acetyltransferase-like isoleucine patch superfamily enzyme/lysophospholipase L1-like esterase
MSSAISVEDLRQQYGARIAIGAGCRIDESVIVRLSSGGYLDIGANTNIARGTTLEVLRGGSLTIGPMVNIGENTFIAAMSRVVIGEGSALSNMVDIHDHGHRDRTYINCRADLAATDDVNGSGFDCAPIVLEPFVTISNKVSITAGVRIGQNTKVGANAVVARSLPPNCVAVGVPARPVRTFAGPLRTVDHPARLGIGFFGTSIMQHLEAYAPGLFDQMNLPQVGERVEVTEWRTRGYVNQLALMAQARWPHVLIDVKNHGYGGANTFKLLDVIDRQLAKGAERYDLVLFSGGINDVWRRFQGRLGEAVDIEAFEANYRQALVRLATVSRSIICLAETPVGTPDANAINAELARYNAVAARVAREHGSDFVDLWAPFLASAESRRAIGARSLWSDGVHLSEDGDATLSVLVGNVLFGRGLLERLLTSEVVDRSGLQSRYPTGRMP